MNILAENQLNDFIISDNINSEWISNRIVPTSRETTCQIHPKTHLSTPVIL